MSALAPISAAAADPPPVTEAGASKPLGVYIGDGLPPVPGRIAARICRWEFVEMHELLPELLASQKGEDCSEKHTSRAKGRKSVQDIDVWLQYYAVFVRVVARHSPETVPELMAYMVNIIRASQEYEGSAWAAYDAAFRRQAATTGHREWSKINTSLYTICFTGKARRVQRCEGCLSASHKTAECYVMDEDPDMARRVRAVESAVVAFSSTPQSSTSWMRSQEICRLFNERKCQFRNCKYRHVCKWCEGGHAGVDCRSAAKQEQGGGPGPVRRLPPRNVMGGTGAPY